MQSNWAFVCLVVATAVQGVRFTTCLNAASDDTSHLSSRIHTFWDVGTGNYTHTTSICAMFLGSPSDLAKLRTLSVYAMPGGHMEHEHFQVQEGQHVCIGVPVSSVLARVYSKDFAGKIVDCQLVQLS